eukprot:comp23121_c0_seq1/m.37249 comp23121_c0_seq1/g.37249  ORF comp23121_c0_seq1/g.37249 comp23121_c0_seq1/m.37249 type:complete len:376 (-) comp23121_c0_seq1:86-1213(-)
MGLFSFFKKGKSNKAKRRGSANSLDGKDAKSGMEVVKPSTPEVKEKIHAPITITVSEHGTKPVQKQDEAIGKQSPEKTKKALEKKVSTASSQKAAEMNAPPAENKQVEDPPVTSAVEWQKLSPNSQDLDQTSSRSDPNCSSVADLRSSLSSLGVRVDSCGDQELVDRVKLAVERSSPTPRALTLEATEPKGPPCMYCNKNTGEDALTALGGYWHRECFFCAHCGRHAETDECFYNYGGKAYCKRDYEQLFGVRCGGCGKAVEDGEVLEACDMSWHQDCFGCMESGCDQKFPTGDFWEHKGKAYCEVHYWRVTGQLCEACQRPLEGSYLETEGMRFHPPHFRCVACSAMLAGKPMVVRNKRLMCVACSDKEHTIEL